MPIQVVYPKYNDKNVLYRNLVTQLQQLDVPVVQSLPDWLNLYEYQWWLFLYDFYKLISGFQITSLHCFDSSFVFIS